MKVEKSSRSSISVELKDFDQFAKELDFMEVCKWSNWEGYDITISSSAGNRFFSLTQGELQALNFLLNHP
jgi:hypothetical protein